MVVWAFVSVQEPEIIIQELSYVSVPIVAKFGERISRPYPYHLVKWYLLQIPDVGENYGCRQCRVMMQIQPTLPSYEWIRIRPCCNGFPPKLLLMFLKVNLSSIITPKHFTPFFNGTRCPSVTFYHVLKMKLSPTMEK